WNMIEADLKESGVECPQDQLLAKIGPTLVGTVITNDAKLKAQCIDATHIDRLNLGPIRRSSE
ncbi:MAG TPA: hypothetical protein VMP01_02695, partial [Pirellulaceae bacterium]|nr:hypothetical protein [Pirellulaceae bacterium]